MKSRHAIAVALGVAACVAAGACQRASSIDSPVDPKTHRLVTLGVPDHLNQTPGVAADGLLVVVSWTAIGPDKRADAYVAVSRDEGATFGPAVRVNDVPGEVRPSEQQAPRIATRNGTVAVLWTSRRGSATQIRLALSTDQGRSFGESRSISPDDSPGTRGWASLLIDDAQQIRVLWLDTRVSAGSAKPTSSGGQAGMHSHGGAPEAETRQDVYEAIVGRDGTVRERLVATGVCFCCKTAIVRQGSSVWGAWRDVYPGSQRDISIARLAPASGETRVRVSQDRWKIDGCPEDGPALAAGAGGSIDIIWPTLVDSEPMAKGIFFASSPDGETFSARVRLDDGGGSASHPALASSPNGDALAVWDVIVGQERRIDMRERRPRGWEPVQSIAHESSASSPSVAALARGYVVAWGRQGASGSASAIQLMHVPGRQ